MLKIPTECNVAYAMSVVEEIDGVDKRWSTVYLGYAQGSRLSADRCANYELDGDASCRQGFYPDLATMRA